MTNAARIRVAALLLFFAVSAIVLGMSFTAGPLLAQKSPAERARVLDDSIKCMCGGCDEAAGKCNHSGGAFAGPCDTAKKEMKEVAERIAMGQSDDLILQSFVQEYGPTVLISPPTKGFDLWAWLMPIIVPLAGIGLALFFIMRWKKRVAVAPAPRVSAELLARAQQDFRGRLDD